MTCSFVNHWCGPNCYTQSIGHTMWMRAVQNIKPGEELTCTITPTVSRRFNAAVLPQPSVGGEPVTRLRARV